jgi:hypothetical protein
MRGFNLEHEKYLNSLRKHMVNLKAITLRYLGTPS